jgi:uncharacterized protein YjbI with pentapeptide repeats
MTSTQRSPPGTGSPMIRKIVPDKLWYGARHRERDDVMSRTFGETNMKLHRVKECLNVHDSDISGSVYDDVNMSGSTVGNVNLAGCSFTNVNMSGTTFEDANLSGWKLCDVNLAGLKITKANLAGASITQGRIEGMTIDGILVSDLLEAYRASQPAEDKSAENKGE